MYIILVTALLFAVGVSAVLTGFIILVNTIIRKVDPKWGAKIDEFWKYF